MIQQIRAVYRQFVSRMPIMSPVRRDARLEIMVLEARCTPAVTVSPVVAIQPPEIIQFQTFAAATPSTATVLATHGVRTDLFGSGEGHHEQAENADECRMQREDFNTWFAENETPASAVDPTTDTGEIHISESDLAVTRTE